MSEQELKKWYNKYKLWAILNDTYEMNCASCPIMNWKKSGWPEYEHTEKILSDGNPLIIANQCRYKRMMIDINTREIFWGKIYKWREGKYCIEWIKNV